MLPGGGCSKAQDGHTVNRIALNIVRKPHSIKNPIPVEMILKNGNENLNRLIRFLTQMGRMCKESINLGLNYTMPTAKNILRSGPFASQPRAMDYTDPQMGHLDLIRTGVESGCQALTSLNDPGKR